MCKKTPSKKSKPVQKKGSGKRDIRAGEYARLIHSAPETCYNPECNEALFTIRNGRNVKNGFKVAHIRDELESPDNDSGIGHRYYPADDLTQDERNRYENLILTCDPCHNIIDQLEPLNHTVELLHEWKRQAESEELREVLKATFGDKALTVQDWADALLDGSAIKSVHTVSEEALETLDSRFSVTSEYSKGRASFRLDAKEPVKTDWIVGGNTAHYADKLKGMIKRAESFSIQTEDLTIEGSKLFAKITEGNEGVMVLTPTGIPAAIKLSLTETSETSEFRFDEINGTIKVGTEVIVFDGTCFDGIFKLHIEASTTDDEGKFNFEFDLSKWDGQNIRKLDYFQKIHAANRSLGAKAALSGTLELKGEDLIKFHRPTDELNAVGMCDYQCVIYTDACRNIANHFNQTIEFNHDIEFTKEEHIAVRKLADFIGMVNNSDKEIFTLSTSYVASDDIFADGSHQNLVINKSPFTIFVGIPSMDVKLFEKQLNIPRRANYLNAMIPIIQTDSKPAVGETYHVTWTSSDVTTPLFYFEGDDHHIPDHMFDDNQNSIRFAHSPVSISVD